MLLAIDTSTRYAGVALADAQRVISCCCWHSAVNHTVELMPAIARTLQSHQQQVGNLDAIALALGPGGFSALRVGLSAGKGLAMSARKPVIGVRTLELEAFPYRNAGLAVCAWLDAGRKEVAAAWFDASGQRIWDDRVAPPEEMLDQIQQEANGPILFCGEGVASWGGLIRERMGAAAMVLDQPNPATRLWSLAAIARQRLDAGLVDDLATLQPYYLRMPSIGGPKRRDWTPQQS